MPGSEEDTPVLGETCACLSLSEAISLGHLQDIFNQQQARTAVWMDASETPTQKACSCCQLEIVKTLLLEEMKKSDQMVQDTYRRSLELDIAAGDGNLDTVKNLYNENSELIHLQNSEERYGLALPVVRGSNAGHREVTRYLFEETPVNILMEEEGFWVTCLLIDAIFYGFLDIVLDVFDKVRENEVWSKLVSSLTVTTTHPYHRSSPIRFLALKPEFFRSNIHLGFWQRLAYSCVTSEITKPNHWYQRLFWKILKCLPRCFGINKIRELKERDTEAKKLLQILCETTQGMIKDKNCKETVEEALLEAVENGNKEFFVEIIKHNPQLLWISHATSGRNHFQLAVQFRKENIFNLIYGLDKGKVTLLRSCDRNNNNILHIAAHLSPPDQLSKISGAGLKMQREIQWFEEVKSLVSEREVAQKNNESKTPRQVFEVSHEPLRKEAEEWMKSTATACSFVAAIIATVTFQAIFTVPGGNDENLGEPRLLRDSHFMVFVIVDSISFFASCTSVLIFLSILTSRYAFDDFIVSLPKKMLLALTILFVAIVAMLIAFTTSLFTLIRKKPTLVVSVVPFAYLPAVIFMMMQYPLLKEMFSFTYGKGLFDRDTKLNVLKPKPVPVPVPVPLPTIISGSGSGRSSCQFEVGSYSGGNGSFNSVT